MLKYTKSNDKRIYNLIIFITCFLPNSLLVQLQKIVIVILIYSFAIIIQWINRIELSTSFLYVLFVFSSTGCLSSS